MADVRRGRWRSGREERERVRRWGRRGALQACWVAECRQLEEELMGMVSAGSGVSGESFSTLPLTAPRLSSLWNSAPPAPTQVCVCVFVFLWLCFMCFDLPAKKWFLFWTYMQTNKDLKWLMHTMLMDICFCLPEESQCGVGYPTCRWPFCCHVTIKPEDWNSKVIFSFELSLKCLALWPLYKKGAF